MWDCYVCGFQNVDAAPVCAKCRARKPAPGEEPMGRSFHVSEEAAKSRVADTLLTYHIPPAPSVRELQTKWQEVLANPSAAHAEFTRLEQREYALRDAIHVLVGVVKNPQARGVEELLAGVLQRLIDWD